MKWNRKIKWKESANQKRAQRKRRSVNREAKKKMAQKKFKIAASSNNPKEK
jgi:hypothetical protein